MKRNSRLVDLEGGESSSKIWRTEEGPGFIKCGGELKQEEQKQEQNIELKEEQKEVQVLGCGEHEGRLDLDEIKQDIGASEEITASGLNENFSVANQNVIVIKPEPQEVSAGQISDDTESELSVIQEESHELQIQDIVSFKNYDKLTICLWDCKEEKVIGPRSKRSLIQVMKVPNKILDLYRCSRCLKYFKTSQAINTHVKLSKTCFDGRSVVTAQCVKCGLHFASTHSLKCHDTQVHMSEYISDDSSVDQHMNGHLNTSQSKSMNCGKFHCTRCDRYYASQWGLECHMYKSHAHGSVVTSLSTDEMMRQICTKCGHYYASAEELTKHVNQVHKAESVSECSNESSDEPSADEHIKSYWQTSKIKCAECGHYFPSPESLKRHVIQVHKSKDSSAI